MVSATAEFSRHDFGLCVPPLQLSSSLLKDSFVAVPETSTLRGQKGLMCRGLYLTLVREA